jgi:hypothetical protein
MFFCWPCWCGAGYRVSPYKLALGAESGSDQKLARKSREEGILVIQPDKMMCATTWVYMEED